MLLILLYLYRIIAAQRTCLTYPSIFLLLQPPLSCKIKQRGWFFICSLNYPNIFGKYMTVVLLYDARTGHIFSVGDRSAILTNSRQVSTIDLSKQVSTIDLFFQLRMIRIYKQGGRGELRIRIIRNQKQMQNCIHICTHYCIYYYMYYCIYY